MTYGVNMGNSVYQNGHQTTVTKFYSKAEMPGQLLVSRQVVLKISHPMNTFLENQTTETHN